MRIEGNQLATIGLPDADGDLATELGKPGLFIPLVQEAERFTDHLILGGEPTVLHDRADNLLPFFRQMNHHS
jgi:hypothetical protein